MAVLLSSMKLSSPSSFNFNNLPSLFTTTKPSFKICTSTSKMALNHNHNLITAAASSSSTTRKLPILLFDVMDTIVRDPFYHHIPHFFGMSMTELIECKHPTAWIEFEKGLIDERELAEKFFKDGRPLDMEGLKNCMKENYAYVEGVEELLCTLKKNGYEIHAFTNYPIWYQMIEDKLKLSNYLSWTFCSCHLGLRKPDPDFYSEVPKRLDVESGSCVFIDDRLKNVDAAIEAGFTGFQFKNADTLRKDLTLLGVDLTSNIQTENQDLAGCS